MKFGYVRSLFGVISLSSITVYVKLAKLSASRSLIVSHIDNSEESLPDADILVFNGLKALLDNRKNLHSGMVVVVCAGPIQLSSIPDLIPLDYTRALSYEFNLIKPSYSKVLKATRCKSTTNLRQVTVDSLAMILDNTIEGGVLLTPLNSLFSMSNMTARSLVRSKLSNYILGEATLSDLIETVESLSDKNISSRVANLVTTLKTKEFETFASVLSKVLNDEMSLTAATKKYEKFELNYLLKMVRNVRRVEKKKFT